MLTCILLCYICNLHSCPRFACPFPSVCSCLQVITNSHTPTLCTHNFLYHYRNTDDPRLAENEACLDFFRQWHSELQSNSSLSPKDRKRHFISDKLFFDLHSMVKGFQKYCENMLMKFPQAGVEAAWVNQDKSENLFGFIRSANGQNEMPNVLEYGELIFPNLSILPDFIKRAISEISKWVFFSCIWNSRASGTFPQRNIYFDVK